MKLKYKKIILLTTMSIMGIGLLTLSVTNEKSKSMESAKNSKAQEVTSFSVNSDMSSVTPVVTTAPSPTALPVYDIEKDAYPEIKKLFVDFYNAKNDRDITAMKKLLSDPDLIESKDELKKKTEYIDEYKNIKTYTKKSFQDGTYIVYVYHEIKFAGIDTPAPGLSKFYVIKDATGNLKIFSGEMDESTKAYYDDRDNDKDVGDLIAMTDEKSDKAIKKDKDLKTFWEKIDKLAKKADSKEQTKTTE